MLARLASRRRAHHRWEGQPRGGGTSGPAEGPERIETGSGSAEAAGTSVPLASLSVECESVTAHDAIDAQAPASRSEPHASCGDGVPP